jgi:hypothetical protein
MKCFSPRDSPTIPAHTYREGKFDYIEGTKEDAEGKH